MGSDARITLNSMSLDDFLLAPGWRTVWVANPKGNVVEISQRNRDEEET